MFKTLVLTLRGRDQPGLLERLANVVSGHGGSFSESRTVVLGGRIVGLHLVALPAARVADLLAKLETLSTSLPDFVVDAADGDAAGTPGLRLRLDLVGHDRAGIVHEVTQLLARHAVSIEEFETRVVHGAFAGGEMFEASARLCLPAGLAPAQLRSLLAALAQEMMVDIALEEPLR